MLNKDKHNINVGTAMVGNLFGFSGHIHKLKKI